MISYVLPTHNRPAVLVETLAALAALPRHDAQVVIVDNASSPPALPPRSLANGIAVEVVRLDSNTGAAARNAGVRRARQLAETADAAEPHWVVMLDDDSAPMDTGFLSVLASAPRDVAVVGAEVFLPPLPDETTRHEAGGLPEVFIGCGAAIRAEVFERLGGYDAAFDYYAEEYDFSARVILAGMHVVYDRRFKVMHRKVESGRDLNRIIGNLVRNNAWVMARYAPDDLRDAQVQAQITRYARIAEKEHATAGYDRGLAELRETLTRQQRRPMPLPLWRRFTGYQAVADQIGRMGGASALGTVAIIGRGKNVEEIEQALADAGVPMVPDPTRARTHFVGTLSPGPMVDACERTTSHTAPPAKPAWNFALAW